jgi:hypothetical protein
MNFTPYPGRTVTSRLFEAYLKCPTKCFLWSRGETGTSNTYADWAQAQTISYRSEGIRRLKDGVASNECITGPLDRKELKSAKWCLAVYSKAGAENLESAIDAVQRAPRDTPGKPAQFVPIRFIFHRHEKLLLAFDAFVLSETLGQKVDLGQYYSRRRPRHSSSEDLCSGERGPENYRED